MTRVYGIRQVVGQLFPSSMMYIFSPTLRGDFHRLHHTLGTVKRPPAFSVITSMAISAVASMSFFQRFHNTSMNWLIHHSPWRTSRATTGRFPCNPFRCALGKVPSLKCLCALPQPAIANPTHDRSTRVKV